MEAGRQKDKSKIRFRICILGLIGKVRMLLNWAVVGVFLGSSDQLNNKFTSTKNCIHISKINKGNAKVDEVRCRCFVLILLNSVMTHLRSQLLKITEFHEYPCNIFLKTCRK